MSEYTNFQGMQKEEIFKMCKLEGYLDSKILYSEKVGDLYKNKSIRHAFQRQFNCSSDEYDSWIGKYQDIPKIRQKFTISRQKGFDNSFKKFYDWYQKEEKKCHYCGISQERLTFLFKKGIGILPISGDAQKRSNGTLEIERLDTNKNEYEPKNMVLACPLCNNAKSNLIDAESWRELFVEPIQKYYQKCLDIANLK